MAHKYTNIYKKARRSTLLTQESAAEVLGLSAETVKQYEGGRRVPPDAVVQKMVELYETPWLAFAHEAEQDTLGVLPKLTENQSLPTAVLSLINRCLALSDDYRQLMAIAEDGVVDEVERPVYDQIAVRVREVVRACFQVLYAEGVPPDIKKDRPDVSASERPVQGLHRELSQDDYSTRSRQNASPNFHRTGGDLL